MIASNEKKKSSVRQLACEILHKVEIRKAYLDILLDNSLKDSALSERDRALLTEITHGTLRWRGKIDACLRPYFHRSSGETHPFIRNLLRVTLYQLLFLDKIPDYAAVNEAVHLAKAHGGEKIGAFVNGVLRNFLRDRSGATDSATPHRSPAYFAIEYSHPQWLVNKWLDYFGVEETEALMKANNQTPPLVLRVNCRKGSREKLLKLLWTHDIPAVATSWSPVGITLRSSAAVDHLPGFREGLFQVQGEASQLVSYLLAPKNGERILDACAAPGGKTSHIAELMADTGKVVATDSAARGVQKIEENIARLELSCVSAVRADVSQRLGAPLSNPYDRILLDAPCSGLGTLRSHPEIKWQRATADVERLSALQKNLLRRVASYLKPGGILVYSTCTLAKDENEDVVDDFLEDHPEFDVENAAGHLPPEARSLVRGSYFMALPHRHNTDGFFAARIRKAS